MNTSSERPASARLSAGGVCKSYAQFEALRDVMLEADAGELLTILGPSGSGKTTLLKCISGFEIPERGTITLGGRDITVVPPAHRNIGMVFQNYALFPHMTVFENVAFPLEMKRFAKSEIQKRVLEALRLVELGGLEQRYPKQLSGGQQQRVAFARAVVFEPSLLLLDEPFGALDRKLRESMQLEVRRLQRRLKITTIFITHDQEEALILSDRIAIMNQGQIEQVGTPRDVYERPQTNFVADFVGESNIFVGIVESRHADQCQILLENGLRLRASGHLPMNTKVGAVIRPERFKMAEAQHTNHFNGKVTEMIYAGMSCKARLTLSNGSELLFRASSDEVAQLPRHGDNFSVYLEPKHVHLIELDFAS